MQKQTKFHHSVTELGNLQLRQVVEYVKDGKVKDKKHSDPVTPADPYDTKDWDVRSQDIVAAITDPEVRTDAVQQNLNAIEIALDGHESVGLAELVSCDRVVEEDGKIAVRRITRILDDGVEVSKKFHRSWIMPGDDPSNADVISKALALKLHTPECIADYKAKLAAQAEENI